VGTPELALHETRNQAWTGQGTVLSIFGRWNVDMVIQRSTGGVEVPLTVLPRLPNEDITSQAIPGQPTVYSIGLPGGAQLQTYIDPGKSGNNSVHFTFFGADGKELPIAGANASALTPDGSTETLTLQRFSKGHFAANTKLDPGRWLFLVSASGKNGDPYTGYFRQEIP
jgi:hypothetical protein